MQQSRADIEVPASCCARVAAVLGANRSDNQGRRSNADLVDLRCG
jgi:hypothetical protein